MKKYKRNIVVEEMEYIWTLQGNDVNLATDWIIITLVGTSYSRLYINPFIHNFKVTPKSIAQAINTAKELGWNPNENSGDMKLELQNEAFVKI